MTISKIMGQLDKDYLGSVFNDVLSRIADGSEVLAINVSVVCTNEEVKDGVRGASFHEVAVLTGNPLIGLLMICKLTDAWNEISEKIPDDEKGTFLEEAKPVIMHHAKDNPELALSLPASFAPVTTEIHRHE